MNKKGKHKKGKINPSQPVDVGGEKIDELPKDGDKIDNLVVSGDNKEDLENVGKNTQEQDDSVIKQRVPEIISEIVPPPIENKDEETPKKPKRNRGKKKKGKDDDFDDNLDEKVVEVESQPPLEETKVDIPEAETKATELSVVTPTARKKKNKKKNTEQKAEELISTDQETQNIRTEPMPKEPEVMDLNQEFMKPEVTEPEVKPSKKKNKKKKRNDSERSDKEDITCTSAFQKILDEPVESKVDEPVKDEVVNIESGDIENKAVEVKLGQTDTLIEIPKEIKASTPVRDQDDSKEMSTPEGKNKKKNKKDKKQLPKFEEKESPKPAEASEVQVSIPSEVPITDTLETEIKQTMPIVTETDQKEVKSTEEIEVPLIIPEETSPKLKAKIAKPVEKKRKGKQGATESIMKDYALSEPKKVQQTLAEQLQQPVGTIITEQEKPREPDLNINLQTIIGDVSMPSDVLEQGQEVFGEEEFKLVDKGKKRKKGPKTPKPIETDVMEQNLESIPKESTCTEDIISEPAIENLLCQKDIQESIIISGKSDMPIKIDTAVDVPDLKVSVDNAPQSIDPARILLTPEDVKEEPLKVPESTSHQITEKLDVETKSSKKRKKSPKPSKKNQVTVESSDSSITAMKPEEIPTDTCNVGNVTQENIPHKADSTDTTKLYDVEISSMKADESEGSACDFTPDIMQPRSSSQQLLDDNNNTTVIREIFPLDIPENISLVQHFLDSPKIAVETPETSIIPKEEKTDIKSKMMEVNQDMEELRLSIERSLAELTAIEKSEEAVEKQFEDTQLKIVEDVPILKKEEENTDKATVQKEITETLVQTIEDKPLTIQDNIVAVGPRTPKSSPMLKRKTIETQPVLEDKSLESVPIKDTENAQKFPTELPKSDQISIPLSPLIPESKKIDEIVEKTESGKPKEESTEPPSDVPPVCPARKDHKNKHKKKKGKQDSQTTAGATQSASTTSQSTTSQEVKKEEKTEKKGESKDGNKSDSKEKGKQQSGGTDVVTESDLFSDLDYEPIENFEDALTSSVDDVNKSFEMIVKESQEQNNPKINIIAPDEEKTPVSPPKNLLGHPDIPVPSSRRDYKKEKDKIPNEITAKVKIKDCVDIEKKQSKNTQTINKMMSKDYVLNENEEFVYKYSFRKVFLQSSCHVCKKELCASRVSCNYCNLLFYCSTKHKDEDWPQHQALCFAISTIVHLKDQKFIYADAKNITGYDYRLIRMQMIVSCEKVLKRRLVPWEQEALLYPRVCGHVSCREWRQGRLSDCQGCGQISYCTDNPDHFPKSHTRWCKSYSLYQKLVCYQQTQGRLEPKMPTKVMKELYQIPEKINEVLASMYEEKIDMNDIQYAALTQLATAPLTAAYSYQLYKNNAVSPTNGVLKKTSFTIHVVGAELQFEADALNKWEVFFLHLRPDLQELRVVLINYNLNPSNLPLELLGKIKLCENCRQNKRRVIFSFQDKRTYTDYKSSEDFIFPDLVCAFNPSIQRSSVYNGNDPWPSAINAILKLKMPFIITAYTITELHKDCIRIKECSETGFSYVADPKYNNFASVRPDRNFISDDEMPLLFKNYCLAIISGC